MSKNKTDIITDKLLDMTRIEKEQKKYGKFVPDIPVSSTRTENDQLELLNNYFFKKRDLYISKHNRFAAYPLHSHQFTELNYMLSGNCRQVVDGRPLILRQGELLLIGVGISHKIETLNEGDILINILFKKDVVSVEWLNHMKENRSPLIQYLLNLVLNQGNGSRYITFSISKSKELQTILKKMIAEYYSTEPYSNTVAGLYLPILFTTLACKFSQSQDRPSEAADSLKHNRKMIPVFQLIEENYKDINLTKAADLLGYNKTYLGSLIKKTTGVSFTQLVVRRRLYQARLLLNITDLPISDIAHESGFSNKTYFYKVFKQTFGYLPSEEKKHQTLS